MSYIFCGNWSGSTGGRNLWWYRWWRNKEEYSVGRVVHRYGIAEEEGMGSNPAQAWVSLYTTAMINQMHVFISFSAVQIYDLSYVHYKEESWLIRIREFEGKMTLTKSLYWLGTYLTIRLWARDFYLNNRGFQRLSSNKLKMIQYDFWTGAKI